MKLRATITASLFMACLSPVIYAEEVVYQTSFEAQDFPAAPLQDDSRWRNLSTGEGAVAEIVTSSNTEGISAKDGVQQLRLFRPTGQDNPYARLAFLPLANGLKEPFTVSFKIAVVPQSSHFVAQAIVADTSTGSAGALVGIAYGGSGGAKSLYAYGIDKSEYREINTTGIPLEPSQYYNFHLRIDPGNQTYSVEVKKEGAVIGSLKDLHIKGSIPQFNAFGIRMAGGTKNDVLYLDDIVISQ